MIRKKNNNLGSGPYPIDIASPAIRQAIGIHVAQSVSVVRPRVPLPTQDESQAHVHDSYEFTIPFSDSPLLCQDNRHVRLPAGEMICCNPNVLHGPSRPIVSSDFLSLQIGRSFLQQVSHEVFGKKDLSFSHEPFKPPSDLLRIIYHFIDESSSHRTGCELLIGALEVQIAICLIRYAPHNFRSPVMIKKGGRSNMSRAIEAMRVYYAEPFSADALADIAGMSRYHFFRAFKAQTGQTPYEFLKDIRLQKAAEMLRDHDHESSITEICMKVGFAGHSHFAAEFRRKTGMTPSEYRLMNRKRRVQGPGL